MKVSHNPELVKAFAHIAFEVEDLCAALDGQKVVLKPNIPSDGLTVAFVEVNGAPVDLMQYDRDLADDYV